MLPDDKVPPILLVVGLVAEVLLLAGLVTGLGPFGRDGGWIVLHLIASGGIAWATGEIIGSMTPHRSRGVFALCFAFGVTLPLAGGLGAAAALWLGMRNALERHRETPYWQFTHNPELPFTTPIGRKIDKLDSRGFAEQVTFGSDNDDLYGKVLAAGRMRSSLSVEALNAAIKHSDERIRLTAYQTLDRKVTRLNGDIQRLERQAESVEGREQSDTWLQIASNYWELLTLEQGEPVAREQLLDKAGAAARRAIEVREDNRNAHFTLGRVLLRQGKPKPARIILRRALKLGMPKESVLPYLAEAAFMQRDFPRVSRLLKGLDGAFTRYPPLRQLAEQWT